MTTKEIALAVNKNERSVRRWIKKASDKMSSLMDKMSEGQDAKKYADYTLDETCQIIEIGLGKNASDLFRMSSNNNIKEHTQNDQVIIKMMEMHQSFMIKVLDKLDSISNNNQKQIEVKQDYYTLKGYINFKQLKGLAFSDMIRLGKEAVKLSKEKSIEVRRVEDERFGFVNSYQIEILNEVFSV